MKNKLKLLNLEVKSFITKLPNEVIKNVNGGYDEESETREPYKLRPGKLIDLRSGGKPICPPEHNTKCCTDRADCSQVANRK